MKALVLCAGMGTRLGSLTIDTPKPMLRVGDEPLLGHMLRHLSRHGIREVAVNLHFKPEAIRSHFGDGSRWGVQIRYAKEEVLLGTAGTVRMLAPFFGDEPEVVVVYGDLLLDTDLGELARVHRDRHADATLLLHERKGSNSLVRLEPDGRVTAFVERPSEEERLANPHPWVNSGVAIVGPSVRTRIPASVPADLPRDVYVPNLSTLRLYGVPLTGYRCAIDSPDRLDRARDALRSGAYDPQRPVTRLM